jgi:SAM-dependent methyltransferase
LEKKGWEFKNRIRAQYNKHYSLYEKLLSEHRAEKPSMQIGNMKKLIEYASKVSPLDCGWKYLDIGCGDGALAQILLDKTGIEFTQYYGIDFSDALIHSAAKLFPHSNFVVGDVDNDFLPFRNGSFECVLSNSVLHWLNYPQVGKNPRQAISEAFRVLKNTGYFAISVSGTGTAEKFREVYSKTVKEYALKLGSSFRRELYRNDPIGSMDQGELEDIVRQAGFKILKSSKDYEPVVFRFAKEYVKAVEAYGYDMYLAPFPEGIKKQVWHELESEFTKKYGDSPYTHDQFMIYLIASKP